MRQRIHPGGLNLFRIGGIQIAIDPSWLIIFALVLWSLSAGYFPERHPGHPTAQYWLTGLAATLLFFSSVLIHELAHSFVGNRLGQEVQRITLFLFGGMAHLSGEPKTPSVELKIAAVGPLTSLVLGLLFLGAAHASQEAWGQSLVTGVFRYLAFINVALAVFNLLPGFPLDGGRLLRAYFWHRTGSLRAATARAADWGGGIAVGLMILGGLQIFAGALVGGLWLIFLGMFLRGAARAGYYGLALEQTLRGIAVEDVMVADPITVEPDLSVADAIERHFLRHGYAAFPVVTDGRADGLLLLSDVRSCPADERSTRRVRDVMRPVDGSISVAPSATLSHTLSKMAEADVGRLLVTEGDRMRGLITRSAIARFVQVRSALQESAG